MAKTVWHKTSFPGVRYREHPTRKHGVQKDRYFVITYKLNGKTKSEAIGWASEKWKVVNKQTGETKTENWTAQKASEILSELKKNQRTGEGPQTLEEKRELDRQRREEEAQEKAKQERDSVTFGHFFENQYIPTAKLTKKPASYKAEENYFKNWIKPVIGDKPFNDIMPLQIEKIKQNLLKAGRTPRTIEYIFAIIRQVWNMAARDGLTDRPCPTREVKKPKISNGRQRFLSRAEAEKLLEAVRARSEQTYKFCLLSLYCGLRAGEIFNLKWQDIDLNNGMIRVADGKGDKSRYAYMTKTVKEMFSEMDRGKPDELVFKSRTGGKVPRISHVFQRAVTDLDLNTGVKDSRQKVVFHTLRHTFASWLVEAGTDLYVVQRLMGHASFEMVQRYSHLGENALQAAVRRLDSPTEAQRPEVVNIGQAEGGE